MYTFPETVLVTDYSIPRIIVLRHLHASRICTLVPRFNGPSLASPAYSLQQPCAHHSSLHQ